jgi:DNA-binding GntR family transcriptional regulator
MTVGAVMKPRKNLTLVTYERIMAMMANGNIVSGQRLVFVDLARQLGVSRTPVNNALSILAMEGYVDFVPNQGYTVHRLTRQEAEELYEIRAILETGSIGRAIERMTPEATEQLKQKKRAYEQAISGRVHRKLYALDTDFHAEIIAMAGNLHLVKHYRDICKRIFLRFRVKALSVDRIHEIVSEHDNLFEAVSTRDVELAQQLLRKHNQNARENLFRIIFAPEQVP